MNFDGYHDLSILNNCGATGNCNYDVWLFNPQKNIFVENSELSNLTSPSLDPKTKTITESSNWSAVGYSQATYKFGDDGKLILIHSFKQDSNDFKSCTQTTGDLINGEIVTTTKVVDCPD